MQESPHKHVKRIIVAVFGFTLLVIGIVMIALPGPAIIVIPIALGILATEFAWARHLLHKLNALIKSYRNNKSQP
jgi:uncharacterized protein (TIGR02611 family)